MKIRGSSQQILRQISETAGIRCRGRFEKVIKYFKRLEDHLKLFGIKSAGTGDIEETKEHENKWERRAQDRESSVSNSRARNSASGKN